MIPKEILKKIRQIELRTKRLVTETLAGQYHSAFKGQGLHFEEVREYFSESQLANLTLAIATINAWNRFGVSFAPVPGSYQPG